MIIFNENFAMLSKVLEISRIFRENLAENLENLKNMHFWSWEPLKLANLLETSTKNQWKPGIF